MKGARIEDPLAIEFFGPKSQALVAFPKHGAFAGFIYENEGLLAGARGSGEETGFDAAAGKFGAVQFGGGVFADFADIAGAQAPALAGDYGGGGLAAEQDVGGTNFDFGAGCRVV